MSASIGLGVASLVLGILACLTCWIPFLGILGIPLALIGILLGAIGVLVGFVQKTGKGLPFSGIIVSIVSIIIAFSVIGKTTEIITASIKESKQTKQEIIPMGKDEKAEVDNIQTTENDTPKNEPQIEWAPYNVSVKQSDVSVRVTSAQIGKIKIKGLFETKESKDVLLSIELEITNTSDVKKCEYKTWNGMEMSFERDYGSLQDEYGNTYKRITFGMMERPEGQIFQESIYPEKSIKDILIFQVPVEKAKEIRLELPANNIGGEGYFRIAIPTSFIKHQ
ncbi:MAG: DUF4190 domain-containing protein [Candidatus Omnitrophica bacterium]|nr:DUF4190 domain-containing protein [Candidatus Omnitrophota bacterium]MBU1047036.1 DUF4190 domain-containing protein [Candidatus Omnitrophota bacterium]MBU1630712.1 DUF4190 domain-containing protein [Candidatus Omnitrophota bacterium]MBU1767600.1 DUF4190 domain-containing protein [Candidatus Omnitrophota bacterium]MBU1889294.1 DUF4190 domain-containing protein [Candidatus Omnitrophota bacterium]